MLIDLRNVSVAEAATEVRYHQAVAAVTLEQTSVVDGKAMARVHVMLARPAEHVVRSTRNTIRLELTPVAGAGPSASRPVAAAAPAARSTAAPATILDRVRVTRASKATTVTLGGNGRLTPATVMEPPDAPRRLMLDFANVASKAPASTPVAGSALVSHVRVEPTPRLAGATRVVIDVAPGSTYHVEQGGPKGQDLAVVFEPALLLEPARPAAGKSGDTPEPDIPLAQAIANAAPLTPAPRDAVDPIAALKLMPPAAAVNSPSQAAAVKRPPPAPVVAERVTPRRGRAATRRPAGLEDAAAAQPPRRCRPNGRRRSAAARTDAADADAAAPLPESLHQVPGQEKQYVGQPITLDFENADLKSILRVLGMASGLNMIIDPAVPATPVNILLKDLPWDQALEVILRSYQLGYEAEGTVIRIAPLKVLEDEQKQRNSLAQATALAGELQVRTFPLSYAKATDLQSLITASTLSQRGKIQVDGARTCSSSPTCRSGCRRRRSPSARLDRPEPQVEVEARIVQTTRLRQGAGVQWGLQRTRQPGHRQHHQPGVSEQRLDRRPHRRGQYAETCRAPPAATTALPRSTCQCPATGDRLPGAGAVNGAFNLDVAPRRLERSGKGRVLSTPKLTTQNNIQAESRRAPDSDQTVSNNTVTVTFKDAVLFDRDLSRSRRPIPSSCRSPSRTRPRTSAARSTDSRRSTPSAPRPRSRSTTARRRSSRQIFVSQEQSAIDRVPGLH